MNIYKDTLSSIEDTLVITNQYKPYAYTEKDCNNIYERYDVFRVDTVFPIELKHGVLSLKTKMFNIAKLEIKDVINILRSEGIDVYEFITFGETFDKLPALMLRDFTNVHTKVLDGGKSPLHLNTIFNINTISPINTRTITTEVTDSSGNKVHSVLKDNVLYFEPKQDLVVHQTLFIDSLYISVDFAPKRLTSKSDVSYLLNFKES